MGRGGHFIPRFTGPWASSGMSNPSPSSHSSVWVPAHSPSLSSSLQTDSFTSPHAPTRSPSHPLSSSQFWPPGRCVALKQALLIEHLFRHGAGSVACGRAAGGSSRGDIMSYYISWYVLFTCMHAHFCALAFLWERLRHPQQHNVASISAWKCGSPDRVSSKDDLNN